MSTTDWDVRGLSVIDPHVSTMPKDVGMPFYPVFVTVPHMSVRGDNTTPICNDGLAQLGPMIWYENKLVKIEKRKKKDDKSLMYQIEPKRKNYLSDRYSSIPYISVLELCLLSVPVPVPTDNAVDPNTLNLDTDPGLWLIWIRIRIQG